MDGITDSKDISLSKVQELDGQGSLVCMPYDPAIPLLGIHTKEARIERHVYPNVHHSTVYNSQDMEAT